MEEKETTPFDYEPVAFSMGFNTVQPVEPIVMPNGLIKPIFYQPPRSPFYFSVDFRRTEEYGPRPVGADALNMKDKYTRQGIRFLRDKFREWAEKKPKRATIGWQKYQELQAARAVNDPSSHRAMFPDEWLPPGVTEIAYSLPDRDHFAWGDEEHWGGKDIEPPDKDRDTKAKLKQNRAANE
jgi:hypothetical protein